jgi:hypothetical protein
MNKAYNYFGEIYTLTEKKKLMSNNYTFGFYSKGLTLMSLLVLCVFGFATAQAPTIVSTPENLSYETYGSGFTQLNDWVENNGNAQITPADGCGPAVWSNNFDIQDYNPTCGFYAGSVAVTFTYTDACDNVISYTRTATLTDDTPPTCVKPYDLTIACDDENFDATIASYTAYWGPVTDLSHPITITSSYSEDAFDENGQQTITWVFTDACGNTRTWTAVLTVTGDCSGVLTVVPPTNVNLSCEDDIPGVGVDATTTCPDGIVNVEDSEVVTEMGCSGSFTIVRTYVVSDNCGNTETVTQTIVVEDNTPPVFTFVPESADVGCDGFPGDFGNPEASDACGEVVITFVDSSDPLTCDADFDITRTWTATDECGNVATAAQTFTVWPDAEPPTVTFVPSDYTITCPEEPVFGEPIVSDNCSGFTMSMEITSTGSCPDAYTTTKTWTYVDGCGNSRSESQTITVLAEPVAPTLVVTPPTNFDIDCSDPVPGSVVDATTTCPGGDISIVESENVVSNGCSGSFVLTRIYEVSDNCGNSETVTQTITVTDNTPPVFFVVPESGDVGCTAYPDGFGEPSIGDACGEYTLTFEDELAPYICDADFNITRTWTATDECGNVATASQTLTVWPDVEAPTFTFIPGSQTVQCGEAIEFGTPTIVDNCTELTISEAVSATGSCPNGYTTTKTWTATDACGNTAVESQTITVIAAPAPITLAFEAMPASKSALCGDNTTFDTPVVLSNCDAGYDISSVDNKVSLGCEGNSETTRVWTAIDECGNTATTSQKIVMTDITSPEFNLVNQQLTMTQSEYDNWTTPEVFATDECSTVSLSDVSVFEYADGRVGYSWIATDECSNKKSLSILVAVVEDENPSLGGGLEPTTVQDMIVYPNPTAGDLTINFVSQDSGDSTVDIIDLSGKVYSTKIMETYKGSNTLEFNVNHLPVGTYFVRMDNGKEVISHRFVKF